MSTDAHQLQHDAGHDRALIARALGGSLTSAYQPIVDLGRGAVLGYEALLRYGSAAGTAAASPFSAAELFASAARIGRVADMEAAALTAALRARDDLPVDCHLFLKVGMQSLVDERVERVLRAQGDLSGVVLELSGADEDPADDAHDIIETFRDRGSLIAVVDPQLDAGRLDSLMLVEPGFFKLDRQMIAGISASNTKLALVDSVRHLADRLGVGIIAQGIEDLADLRSLERLGIGFGQGYLIARPSTDRRFTTALNTLGTVRRDPGAGSFAIGTRPGAGAAATTIGRLIETACELTEDDLDQPLTGDSAAIEFEVLVTDLREPLALLRRVGRRVECLSLTIVEESASVPEAVRIAMRRPRSTRFDPLVCVDQFGANVGVVRIERMVDVLAGADRAGRSGSGREGGGDGEGGMHRNRHAFDFSCRPPRHRPSR